eukprot:gene10332-11437_t
MKRIWSSSPRLRPRFGKSLIDEAKSYAKVLESQGTKQKDFFLRAAHYIETVEKRLLPSSSSSSEEQTKAQVAPQQVPPKEGAVVAAVAVAGGPSLSHTDSLALRLKLFHSRHYLRCLHHYVEQDKELAETVWQSLHWERFLDAVLLGTASERIAEHMSLFGSKMTEEGLQLCLHACAEADVQTGLFLIDSCTTNLHKKCRQRAQKLAKIYLLDTVELNVKSRSIYSWSATEKGKDGLPPPQQETSVLLYGRRAFFPEAESLVTAYLNELQREDEELDANEEEWKGYYKKGSVFLVVTILLDWLVCSL